MSRESIIALLPMKANSERVRGKNFRLLAGKPLFQWILDELLELNEIDKVVINTDARDILAKHGLVESDRILIRDRKEDLCGDLVSMNAIIADDLAAVPATHYLMTHTTNPLLKAATMRQALQKFIHAPEYDSLFSVNKVQTRFYRKDGSAVNHDPANLIRTQDLELWYEENSCLYIFTGQSFKHTGARIGRKPMMLETPLLESVDIDEPHHWVMASALALQQNA